MQSIIHPTDFSHAGVDAFAHALRLAIAAGGVLNILHIDRDLHPKNEPTDWSRFPRVQETLARWRLSAPDAVGSETLTRSSVKVVKAAIESENLAHGVGSYIEGHPCDLLVLMTHTRSALELWLQDTVAEFVSYRVHAPTLFLREGQRGFVDRETGAMSLKTILLPIDGSLSHRDAWLWVAEFERLVAPGALLHPLHVGSATPANATGFAGAIDVREGSAVEIIGAVAKEIGADLIVMPTAGRRGLFGAFRGSVTQYVLHEAPCPVLAIPTN